jgi:nitroimidazol reductase NimA-like FMN-containing flavoprotein (pyridoxamine 5'-phosphate oxidase superfamily)
MTRADLVAFLRKNRYAVEATVSSAGPQAAVIGIGVTDDLEIVFDTLSTSRKYRNLRADPRMALVVYEGERTVQIEGTADVPDGAELARLKQAYFAAFPDGPERERWPDIAYVRVRPTWIRWSDFDTNPPTIIEL